MRLIDADALIEKHPTVCSMSMKFNLDLAPTVDAAPVVHARWIERDMWYTDMQCDCSACGVKLHVPTCMGKPMYKYCPDCGARMDAEEDK